MPRRQSREQRWWRIRFQRWPSWSWFPWWTGYTFQIPPLYLYLKKLENWCLITFCKLDFYSKVRLYMSQNSRYNLNTWILSSFQYLFIVVKKTVGICNDDLFGTYFDMLVCLFSTSTAFIYNWVPGKMGLNYYICTGENPEPFNQLGKKYPVSLIIPAFTLIIYGSISVKLSTAKKL